MKQLVICGIGYLRLVFNVIKIVVIVYCFPERFRLFSRLLLIEFVDIFKCRFWILFKVRKKYPLLNLPFFGNPEVCPYRKQRLDRLYESD